ncbi:MAG TPA: AAA family ATPase [Pseudolabrys sp.]
MSERAAVQSRARAQAATAQMFIRDTASEAIVRQALQSLGLRDAAFTSGNIDTAISALAAQSSPRLLIVDVSGVDDPLGRVQALAEVCEPTTGLIVIGDRNDIVLYRDLKRDGVVEYFFKPLVGDLVTRTCNMILSGSAEPQKTRTGKLVFVLGVRGGVGATTIAVNTAWHLAGTRARGVMFLDLDLQHGDAALQLDCVPSHALREAFEHPERVDKLFLERAVIHVEQRIDLLASLEPLADDIAPDDGAVLTLLDKLMQRYRFIFADVPPAMAARLFRATMPCTIVMVSNGTLASARDVVRWRESIGPNTAERTMVHVLNQHGAAGSLPDAEFAQAAGQAPDIIIPFDREIAAATTLGIKNAKANAALTRRLAPLLRLLSGEKIEASRSLLRRIFG